MACPGAPPASHPWQVGSTGTSRALKTLPSATPCAAHQQSPAHLQVTALRGQQRLHSQVANLAVGMRAQAAHNG